jgi:hypothetical protein
MVVVASLPELEVSYGHTQRSAATVNKVLADQTHFRNIEMRAELYGWVRQNRLWPSGDLLHVGGVHGWGLKQ